MSFEPEARHSDDNLVITAKGVHKTYGAVRALKGVDLNVAEGETFGFLGPNGAGKTTLVEILVGLRSADKGVVRVLGLDPKHQRAELLQQAGIQTQEFSVQPKITPLEALRFFAGLYHNPLDVKEVLKQLQLEGKENAYFKKLSGGQQKRLSIAKALIGNPRLIFLDEPTSGLDPQGRAFLNEQIRKCRLEGRTVLLTTHDIRDAESLCDRVGIIDRGEIVAEGRPAELITQHATKKYIRYESRELIPDYPWEEMSGIRHVQRISEKAIVLYCDDPRSISDTLQERGVLEESDGVQTDIGSTTLEDVFLILTGRSLRE